MTQVTKLIAKHVRSWHFTAATSDVSTFRPLDATVMTTVVTTAMNSIALVATIRSHVTVDVSQRLIAVTESISAADLEE
jgi:predicted YcjX-like family ATPase